MSRKILWGFALFFIAVGVCGMYNLKHDAHTVAERRPVVTSTTTTVTTSTQKPVVIIVDHRAAKEVAQKNVVEFYRMFKMVVKMAGIGIAFIIGILMVWALLDPNSTL